jgi:AcrR family transcriptional regulator
MEMPTTKRAQRKAATRDAVLAAARQVFLERGYEGATIAAIAEIAGVSPGTVLNASPTKIALLNAIMRDDFEMLGADCDSLAASLSGGVRERTLILLEQHLTRHFNNLDLMSAVFGHCWLGETEVLEEFDNNMSISWAPVRDMLHGAQSEGDLIDGVDVNEIVCTMQDIYLGVLRRAISKQLDMFSASDVLRQRMLQFFQPVLKD